MQRTGGNRHLESSRRWKERVLPASQETQHRLFLELLIMPFLPKPKGLQWQGSTGLIKQKELVLTNNWWVLKICSENVLNNSTAFEKVPW